MLWRVDGTRTDRRNAQSSRIQKGRVFCGGYRPSAFCYVTDKISINTSFFAPFNRSDVCYGGVESLREGKTQECGMSNGTISKTKTKKRKSVNIITCSAGLSFPSTLQDLFLQLLCALLVLLVALFSQLADSLQEIVDILGPVGVWSGRSHDWRGRRPAR